LSNRGKKHITNSSRGIQHAWHFWYALALVLKCHAGTSVLRASPLNWALGAVKHFSVHFSNFSLAICSGFFGNLALSTQALESLNP
ncbi:hypothetical protein, partial [Vibrio parahaemolyticus]|uniref:hypothetical protein n=1 Tax=Vibrio parahaemolyticus TaxID=670 RepID=UPI003F668A2B